MSLADPELPFTALESGRASLSDGLLVLLCHKNNDVHLYYCR